MALTDQYNKIFSKEQCDNNELTKTDMSKLMKNLHQDVDNYIDSSVPEIIPFLAYLNSLNLPIAPPPPPQLEKFDLNLGQKFLESSETYRKNVVIEQSKNEQSAAKQISSKQIIENLPELLKMQTSIPLSDEFVNKIVDRILSTYRVQPPTTFNISQPVSHSKGTSPSTQPY